jgi:hypothetical protein
MGFFGVMGSGGRILTLLLQSRFVGRNPFRVEIRFFVKPRVVARRQPWAKCWNPLGVRGVSGKERHITAIVAVESR